MHHTQHASRITHHKSRTPVKETSTMVRIGIIGSGGMGGHHSRSLDKVDGATITACADIDEQTRNQLAEKHGIEHVVADYRDLLALDCVDAVFVCLPTFLHRDAVVAAAEAGKHVFCEKPIDMKLENAQEMIDACASKGVKFMMGFVRRFDNFWGKMRDLVLGNAIGRPVMWRQCAASGGPAKHWFNDAEKGGGPLIDGAVHNYDFARHTFGEAALAMGSMKNFKPDNTALDTGTGLVRFQSGDEIMLSWSWGLPNGCSGGSMLDILGPQGAISFGAAAEDYPEGTSPDTHGGYTITLEGGEKRVEVYEKNDMFFDEVSHFVDCVANDGEPIVTGVDGKRALEIGLAIHESSHSGQSVPILAK